MAAASITTPLEAARSLRPLSAGDAGFIEAERQLPDHIVKTLVEGNVFHILTPRAIGG